MSVHLKILQTLLRNFFLGGGWEGGGLFVLILLAVPLYEKQLTHANNCTVTLYLLITYQYKWESLCYRG